MFGGMRFEVSGSYAEHQLEICLSQIARGKDNADRISTWRKAGADKWTKRGGEKGLKSLDGCEGEGCFFGVMGNSAFPLYFCLFPYFFLSCFFFISKCFLFFF